FDGRTLLVVALLLALCFALPMIPLPDGPFVYLVSIGGIATVAYWAVAHVLGLTVEIIAYWDGFKRTGQAKV
ncbi:MAG TPA: hypothetical protein PLL57_12885, partial [Flavobacteriales bacterium]|nr:hypothetical protein [Flavobacteriales bacterium]